MKTQLIMIKVKINKVSVHKSLKRREPGAPMVARNPNPNPNRDPHPNPNRDPHPYPNRDPHPKPNRDPHPNVTLTRRFVCASTSIQIASARGDERAYRASIPNQLVALRLRAGGLCCTLPPQFDHLATLTPACSHIPRRNRVDRGCVDSSFPTGKWSLEIYSFQRRYDTPRNLISKLQFLTAGDLPLPHRRPPSRTTGQVCRTVGSKFPQNTFAFTFLAANIVSGTNPAVSWIAWPLRQSSGHRNRHRRQHRPRAVENIRRVI